MNAEMENEREVLMGGEVREMWGVGGGVGGGRGGELYAHRR